ncbi:hypothetical protein [Deinococcus gobiensis]|uniref:Uncharacterized protein n=1 Tax=Deinococcus gobiensis (strain DSM 21396 / JCM 16679 / CGMCC 1.7299 / I-0) TaxID=745776 RepID=H8H1A6_DEIGI|nr:hypothetical protein [Deinococcus gobiensis]AFD27303.1 hypothetical protein DGo_PB0034 [Deinococcus gobiensis I-0]
MIAYCDASVVQSDRAGLGVLLGRRELQRQEYTLSLQHAELQAVALAVEFARPGPLRLHLDCSNAVRALTGGGQCSLRSLPLAAQIHALAQTRGVELEIVRVLSEVNRAHPLSQAAATREGLPAFPCIGSSTVRVRRTSASYTIQGLDPPFEQPLPASSWGSVAVLPRLASRLPPHQLVRILGLTPLAAALWRDPATSTDSILTQRLLRAQWTLKRKGTRLVFPEDLP